MKLLTSSCSRPTASSGSSSLSRKHRRTRSRARRPNSRRSSSPRAGARCSRAARGPCSSAHVFPAFLAGGAVRRTRERINDDPCRRCDFSRSPVIRVLDCCLVETKGRHEAGTSITSPYRSRSNGLLRPNATNSNALAAVRRGPRESTLLDATVEPSFVSFVLENLRASQTVEAAITPPPTNFSRRTSFRRTARLQSKTCAPSIPAANTTVLVGNHYVVKLFRRLEPGINPEIEVGHFYAKRCLSPTPPHFWYVE